MLLVWMRKDMEDLSPCPEHSKSPNKPQQNTFLQKCKLNYFLQKCFCKNHIRVVNTEKCEGMKQEEVTFVIFDLWLNLEKSPPLGDSLSGKKPDRLRICLWAHLSDFNPEGLQMQRQSSLVSHCPTYGNFKHH